MPVLTGENMGMAADHLVDDGSDNIAEIEQPALLGHAGVEHHLEAADRPSSSFSAGQSCSSMAPATS